MGINLHIFHIFTHLLFKTPLKKYSRFPHFRKCMRPGGENSRIFPFEFSKNKSDKMCHMGACMERLLWDVKVLFQEILLRQKNISKFSKKIWGMESLRKIPKIPQNCPFSRIHQTAGKADWIKINCELGSFEVNKCILMEILAPNFLMTLV